MFKKLAITLSMPVLIILFVALWYHLFSEIPRIKRSTDPHAIKSWAEGFIRAHKTDGDTYWDTKPTNLPPGVASIFHFRPSVLYDPGSDYVLISWGRGYPVIDAGLSTHVRTNGNAEPWITGVYFLK
jgi:hypothetical protein